jgi:hypothetical protein
MGFTEPEDPYLWEYLEDILPGRFTREQWCWWLDTLRPRDAHIAYSYLKQQWDREDIEASVARFKEGIKQFTDGVAAVGESFRVAFAAFQPFITAIGEGPRADTRPGD